ncbi:tRNA (adenosine(37)-N6)-threonylcarbamoyltransferase complex dimerization subunit type 1 TsaB [Mollicutes bacterium LVI A0039]|nr:tRNA (adenosine(37)-N6)-threonylcarbamoyltransferase complex dimerization subunit type 1 TsaB [Mollicutes bacterium LVI A0039]
MNLFIDTTTKYVSIIVFDQNGVERVIQYEGNNDHTTTIYQHLAEIDLTKLQAIYVTSGPGSYTGVRIGVLVAKTLAHELHIKLYAINTLELFYNGTSRAVLLDARGKKYFKYDGTDFSQIAYDDVTSEFIIDSYVDASWLPNNNITSQFQEVSPLELKIEYLKEAI